MILLANIARLKKFTLTENERSWWWYYFDANTHEMLYKIDYSDLIDYMDKFHGGSDTKVGHWVTFDNTKNYRVVEVSDHHYENRRVTKIIVT